MNTRFFLYSNIAKIASCNMLLLFMIHGVLAADIPTVAPGAEVSITAPAAEKTFRLYVPVDYTDKRPFPVVFCYHTQKSRNT